METIGTVRGCVYLEIQQFTPDHKDLYCNNIEITVRSLSEFECEENCRCQDEDGNCNEIEGSIITTTEPSALI